jgi:hypothetical protein
MGCASIPFKLNNFSQHEAEGDSQVDKEPGGSPGSDG